MTRIVKTVSTTGESTGGSAGLQASDVCKIISDSIIGTATTSLLPRCQSKEGWELICNCDHWSECYSNAIEFDVDTSKYRAFRWCFRGITHCGCCETTFCMYFVDPNGACQGSNWYRNYDMRNKTWPNGSCCCWCYQTSFDCICWCWYCCNTNCSMPQAMAIEVGQSVSKANCMSGNQSAAGLCYDICYGHRWSYCDCSDWWGGSNRMVGYAWCAPFVWAETQNSCYFKKLRIQAKYGLIPTDVSTGPSWQARWGNEPQGQPCWSMYGIPCTRPNVSGSADGAPNVQTTSFA